MQSRSASPMWKETPEGKDEKVRGRGKYKFVMIEDESEERRRGGGGETILQRLGCEEEEMREERESSWK